MKTKKLNLKAIVLSLGLAAAMQPVQAQGVFGDLLDNYYAEKEQQESNQGGMLRSGSPVVINDNTTDGGLTNQTFVTPLGSGIAILLAAGLGYVALKKKED